MSFLSDSWKWCISQSVTVWILSSLPRSIASSFGSISALASPAVAALTARSASRDDEVASPNCDSIPVYSFSPSIHGSSSLAGCVFTIVAHSSIFCAALSSAIDSFVASPSAPLALTHTLARALYPDPIIWYSLRIAPAIRAECCDDLWMHSLAALLMSLTYALKASIVLMASRGHGIPESTVRKKFAPPHILASSWAIFFPFFHGPLFREWLW
mmetsp:Transcript_23214/g.60741  ORF Transcript_23214/g.60741 Transcript_23214/m.60741 type:complete len:214 (-) Transcript_23214:1109-1750(-)